MSDASRVAALVDALDRTVCALAGAEGWLAPGESVAALEHHERASGVTLSPTARAWFFSQSGRAEGASFPCGVDPLGAGESLDPHRWRPDPCDAEHLGYRYDYRHAVNFATTGGGPEFWLVTGSDGEVVTRIDDGEERVVASSLPDMLERMIASIDKTHWHRSENGVWVSDPMTFEPQERVLGYL